MSDVTLSQILEECGVTAERYDNVLGCVEKKVFMLYKQKPCEVNIMQLFYKAFKNYSLLQVYMQCLHT